MKKHHEDILKLYGNKNQGILKKGTKRSAAMGTIQPKTNNMVPVTPQKSKATNTTNQQEFNNLVAIWTAASICPIKNTGGQWIITGH